jgi:hypothetical protein
MFSAIDDEHNPNTFYALLNSRQWIAFRNSVFFMEHKTADRIQKLCVFLARDGGRSPETLYSLLKRKPIVSDDRS